MFYLYFMIVLETLVSLFSSFQLCSYTITSHVIEFFINLLSTLDYFLKLILDFVEITTYFNLSSSSVSLLLMALKFLLCISLLIFARGGIPRFRFDYLTKLG